MTRDPAFGIKPLYRARTSYVHYDDTTKKDEWQKEVYEYARKLMVDHHLSSVADVGCGSGYKLIKYLGDYAGVGYEISPTYEWLCENHPTRKWIRSDFARNPESPADLVICSDVIEHLLAPDELLAFLARFKSKYIIISTPARDLLYKVWHRGFWGPPYNPAHIREWSFNEFRSFISSYFPVVHHEITNREQRTQMIVCQPR